MTPLRQYMIEDLQLRGMSERPQDSYVRAVHQLAQHYMKSPDKIIEEELRFARRSLPRLVTWYNVPEYSILIGLPVAHAQYTALCHMSRLDTILLASPSSSSSNLSNSSPGPMHCHPSFFN
jgi:hypothetical protein